MTRPCDILVVDDNAANVRLVSFLLRARGYDVRAASDAHEARTAIDERVPSLVLMDIQLPEIDGLALTRELRADPRTRDVCIVAVTAYAMRGDEEKAIAAGCDGYITKPIDTRSLPSTLERYLARSSRARQEAKR